MAREPEPETTVEDFGEPVLGSTEVTAPQGWARRGPFVAILVVVAIAMLAGGGLGAYLLLGDDSQNADADWSEPLSSSDGDGSREDSDDGADERDDETGDDGTEPGGGDGTPLAAEIEAGLYVQLGSFLGDGATREAERLGASGIDAFVVDSNGVAELMPGFKVVVAGPLESDRDQDRVIRAGRAADVDAIAKTLTPATESASSLDVGGATFGGPLTKAGREVDADVAFAGDGRSATIRYERPDCTGDLSLDEAAGASLVYDERIVSGPCQRDGSWSIKPSDGEILATWTTAVSDDFGTATLAGR